MSKELLQKVIDKGVEGYLNEFFLDVSKYYTELEDDLSEYDGNWFSDFQAIGEINFSPSEKMVVVTANVAGDLTERSGKKAQYEKAKKILKAYMRYDAGIFVFSDPAGNFRLSLVYGTPDATRLVWSNFRRFTYFASQHQTNKTFRDRIGTCGFDNLEVIKDAFSVEKVTKLFYSQIADWYFWAVKEVTFPKDAEAELEGRNISVIRLITRLIFIWFMKERGLVSPGFFDKQKATSLLKSLKQEETTYYKAILQNLFFATLNTKIEDRKFRFKAAFQGKNDDYMDHTIYRYETYFKNQDTMLELFKDIPFLNGGLFDCLDRRFVEDGKNSEIRIDGFSDKEVGLSVPNKLFFSDEIEVNLNKDYGTANRKYWSQGLLNILSAYNFTIDENDPNDQEVALDPELLGKVFENLLASYNPETATTARKATGSYYTPREIVDYMVTESLKQYFKTHLQDIADIETRIDDLFSADIEQQSNPFGKADTRRMVALTDDLRIVDPAVGSGAFPMGILNKLVHILAKIDPDNELWKQTQLKVVDAVPDPIIKQKLKEQITARFAEKNANYGRKLYLIEKCIYGVDIQQIAIEIAKLRFFIALLVDEKIDKSKYNWGVEPLPNLDFKLMQGNSLISEFMGINLDADPSQSYGKLIKDELDILIDEFQVRKSDFQSEADPKKKSQLKKTVENLIIEIFESKLKEQKTGYLNQLKSIENKYSHFNNNAQIAELIAKEVSELNRKSGFDLKAAEKQLRDFTTGYVAKPFFAWKLYFAEVFQGKGGFDIVIANPPYIFSREKLTEQDKAVYKKSYSLTQFKINLYILFIEKAFNILNNNGSLIFITPNNWLTLSTTSDLRYYLLTKTHDVGILLNYDKVFENASVDTCILSFRKIGDSKISRYQWTGNGIELRGVRHPDHYLNKIGYVLNDLDENGSVNGSTVCEKVVSQATALSDLADVKNGVQAYTVGEGDPIQTEEMKINRVYHSDVQKNKAWIKYLDGVDVRRYEVGWSGQFIKYGGNLTRPRDPLLFMGERLLVRQIPGQLPYCILACYTEAHTINDNNSMIIKATNNDIKLKYILGIINSKLISFWFAQTFGKLQRKIFPQFKVKELRTFPIKEVPVKEQLPIISRVGQIIIAKELGAEEDTALLEQEIDQLVYQLYGLTEEEIAVVEGKK